MVNALIGEGVGVGWSTAYLDEAENCAEVIVLNLGRVLSTRSTPSSRDKVKGLTRRFGSFTAADRITFETQRREIFGLLGVNGAGESTTFQMMCCLLRPSEGTVLVDGLDPYRAPREDNEAIEGAA